MRTTPWKIQQRDGKYCVVKVGDSAPVPGGCHSSRADAIKHQRALYANEPSARAGSVSLMASAPLKPPAAWFGRPETDVPTPLTVTADGEVFGHLALWDTCHTGFLNGGMAECVKAPRSQTDYAHFHLGRLETAEGTDVAVGKLTYGTGHAPMSAGLQAASSHYDSTGQVGAFVRATNGHLGVWLSGALRSDVPPEGVRDIKANPPSGDWRLFQRSLELIASLAVPVPGFPVQVAMTASGATAALILGMDEEEEEMTRGRSYTRRKAVIKKSIQAAALTTKARDNLPKSSFAIPETKSYPIQDRAHAANALARSSGKPEEGRVKRAVCRRYPDLPACG